MLLGKCIDFRTWVHESVSGNSVETERHASLIASHLIAGVAAFVGLGIYVAIAGNLNFVSLVAFVWLISPIGISLFLMRTGKLDCAYLLSTLNLTCLVVFVMAFTGGIQSFLIAWLIVIPLEAALSGKRSVIAWSAVIVTAGFLGLFSLSYFQLMPAQYWIPIDSRVLILLSSLLAAVYAFGLAVAVLNVHQRSEEKIIVSEHQLGLLAENSSDIIIHFDRKGHVLFASPASQNILGVPSEQILGDRFFARVHVSDRPAYLTAIVDSVESGNPVAVTFRALCAGEGSDSTESVQNAYKWFEMRCRPIAVAGYVKDNAELVAIIRDISDQKELERTLRDARNLAQQANESKTQFLANISHELRTPLNAVIGFSEILKREMFGELGKDKYKDYARLIHESGTHLLSVVNDILDMSKIEAGKYEIQKEDVDIELLVQSCCDLMLPLAEKKSVTIRQQIESDLSCLIADQKACKQILLNLLSNAIKYSNDNGCVEIGAVRDGNALRLSVRDNGIGIEKDQLSRLGKPFVQIESSYSKNYEGTGLGLSVVNGLVQLHGGEMKIESTPGSGTKVLIMLPIDGTPFENTEDGERAAMNHSVARVSGNHVEGQQSKVC